MELLNTIINGLTQRIHGQQDMDPTGPFSQRTLNMRYQHKQLNQEFNSNEL